MKKEIRKNLDNNKFNKQIQRIYNRKNKNSKF